MGLGMRIDRANFESTDVDSILRKYLDEEHYIRLKAIPDPELHRWIANIVQITNPSKVYVIKGDPEDFVFVKKKSIENGEEIQTKYRYKTVHFDGPMDLARDRGNTRILIPNGGSIPYINTLDRENGLNEITGLYKNSMNGKIMYVIPLCLGPPRSVFTIYAIQVTDSAYVAHSELILYRICYEEFKQGYAKNYIKFLHSVGELNERVWCKNISNRRIYIDLVDQTVYSINTEYAGNTVGPKKLALRLCIYRGYLENWLCEHMFIIGVKGPGDRITYFTGAYPAGCGKTSTAMIADTIIGDDIAIIKAINSEPRAVNTEIGSFGIIDGVNPKDDPEIYSILLDPGTEVIFSNILLCRDGEPWWNGRPEEPCSGLNWNIEWWPGKTSIDGKPEPPSHPNARFTTYLKYFSRLDPNIDNPNGVLIEGMIFGGRDSDTHVPVEEAFDWVHGVITKGAALESERTAAVLGTTGVREFNPFAILDFLSISIGKFIELHLRFRDLIRKEPKIFGVNYFLKDEKGRYLNDKVDKLVWLKWMELRVHGDVDAVETPTGYIPLYIDLTDLFNKYLGKEFSEIDYEKQFMIRIPQHLDKIERIWKIYSEIPDTPVELFNVLREQRNRLKSYRDRFGDYISPFRLDRL
ncbi:MAG: phosphoenolpyruvate carboxykinase (GTP) [Desulfurococcaceae archaeon]